MQLHHPAKAISVSKDIRDQLASVRIAAADGTETDSKLHSAGLGNVSRTHDRLVPCTRLVLTAGCWTPRVFSTLFPSAKTRIPVTQLAGHSLLLKSPRWSAEHEEKGCHAVFATDNLGFSPELFSRIGGEIYISGLNSTAIPLPEVSTDAKISDEAVQQLKQVANRMLGLPGQEDLEVLREGLCFRPVTNSGRPIISRIPDNKLGGGFSTRGGGEGGVFVAAGHGAWGKHSCPGAAPHGSY